MFNNLYKNLFDKVIFTGLLTTTLLASPQLSAKGVYQSGPDFVAEVFAPQQPEPGVLWLNKSIRQEAEKILGRKVLGLAGSLSSICWQDRLDSQRDWQGDANHYRRCDRSG